MNKPKVTVIMTVKNGAKSLETTIKSILSQTFKDFEFIIVDDFSEDNTYEILQKYAKEDTRIKIIKNDKWLGRCISRNKALEQAKGEYIAITDSDDISSPRRFAEEVVFLDMHKECYLVGSRAELRDEDGKQIGISWGLGYDGEITNFLEEGNKLVHSSVMFRNTGEFKYREKFLYAQDYDFFLQMVLAEKSIFLLQEILLIYSTKKDLIYDDYLIKQRYFAEIAKYIFKEKRDNYKDLYETFDNENLEQYVPEKVVIEMQMKKHMFNKQYKDARKYAKQLLDLDPSPIWRLYFFDTFLHGLIFRLGKTIKRELFNSKLVAH